MRRLAGVLFAGDRRVWLAAAVVGAPLVALIAFYCLRPREYFTGTNSVEVESYLAPAQPGEPLCVRGLQLPAHTAGLRLALRSATHARPALTMTLTLARQAMTSALPPRALSLGRTSTPVFRIPETAARPGEQSASLCVRAAQSVSWGGTRLATHTGPISPTVGGRRLRAGIAIFYLPRAGARRSFLDQTGTILRRASLFRPGLVGPWLYVALLVGLLPALAIASVRCLALASESRPRGGGRLAAALFAIAALNFCCWALIDAPFQSPDEIDHFAYTQSLVERGQAPSRSSGSPLKRWSSAELLALNAMSFFSDRQARQTHPPWTRAAERLYDQRAARHRPSPANGGGYETAATSGAIYYAALAPGYLAASASPLDQLTLMRLSSALIGALTVVFTFLLARELAPGRAWLAVLAALLVAYQPMFGSIAGAVNNDVGVNAAAAALEMLLIMIARRGLTLPLGVLTGGLLIAAPVVKGTAYALYPVAAVTLLATLWRQHRRADAPAWAGLVLSAGAASAVAGGASPALHPPAPAAKANGGSEFVVASLGGALSRPLDYLAYVWQVFLPRLSFMTAHFHHSGIPAFAIYVERGWAAFNGYDILFPHWVYVVILVAMLATPALSLIAARWERVYVRRNVLPLTVLALVPLAVIAGVEAAFYTHGARRGLVEAGRYAFPAIAPLAVLVVGSLHAFGRRRMLIAGAGLLGAMLALSYASQLLTLTSFYA